ncbi:PREDICTED: uncharacterized protein LOC109222474 [Nicotiana attenuata]|uniref:uncharacterized protein LOC109222474 n=1 Tax=Nicotiana attenuata TaxID=49451 RepID=UPI000905B581|nr:PREDICTED: uncharacterized protein LOC109222474 [Nicotiana attenuata]
MTDYFSKWVEAHVFEKVREQEIIDFIWDHIICQFGIPTKITCDNGRQFIGIKVNKFFEDHKIKKILSTPYRLSTNSQADSTNKTILQNLKKRLTNSKQRWKDILPQVLWAYRTTSRSSTGETLFSLVYGAEALIPVEVGELSLRSHLQFGLQRSVLLAKISMLSDSRGELLPGVPRSADPICQASLSPLRVAL